MTRMKKRGGCKLFQSLARAFSRKKKSTITDDDGIVQEPFSSHLDVSEVKQAVAEKDPARQGTTQDKVHAKKPPREVPTKAAKATSIDLDKVQREAGLINSEIAKDRLKIRPSKRAPRKYAERLEQRSDSVDRIAEVPVTVKSENNKAAENLLLASNQKGKGSVTPERQPTEGNINNEKSNKAPAVAQKQRGDATDGNEGSGFHRLPSDKKSAKRLPRADVTEQAGAHGIESDKKAAGAANQLGSDGSSAGKGSTKAAGNVHLEAEIAGSGFRGSGKSGTVAEGLSQSTKEGRKLPRTLLNAGQNEPEPGASLGAPFANEADSKLASTAKLYASGSSLNAPEPGLRDSHRRSSKAIKTESTKHLGVGGEDDTKLADNKLRSSGRGSTKTKGNSKESNIESEAKASKIRESTKKKKDGKKERNSVMDITDDTSAESGIPKGEGKPIEHAGENSGTDINQNKNLSSSLKNRLPDTTESSEENATKALRKEKEAKTGVQRVPSTVKETGLKETSVGEVTGDGSLTSKGGVKPAKDKGITEIAVHGDAKTAENRKSWRIEPYGAKALAAARHSRDASVDSAGNSTVESSEGEKTGEGAKTAPLLSSSESISAIGETGGSGSKASGEAGENEFSKAFQKIKTKQTTSDDARNSFRLRSDRPKDGVAATESSEKGIPESGSLKADENLSENRLGASVKSLRGSGRKAGGDSKPAENNSAVSKSAENNSAISKSAENNSASSKPAENHSAVSKPAENHSAVSKPAENNSAVSKPAENHSAVGEEDKKPGSLTADADDGGEGGSSLNKRKLPPAPPANKRSVKVQPKPAENGKEVAWASMARRMSREFCDMKLQNFEAKNDEQNPDHDIEGEGNFERGGEQGSVKERVRKMQQNKQLNS